MPRTQAVALVSRIVAALVMMAAAGCSSGGPAETTGFVAGPLITVNSQSGQLKIDVRTSPQPPERGTNDVELTITGAADGLARDGLALGIKPWMPAMGHGSSIVPIIAPKMNGKYLVSNVDLFMPGLWQLRLTISGQAEDYAAPAFEIQ
jgi:hypothetical protein